MKLDCQEINFDKNRIRLTTEAVFLYMMVIICKFKFDSQIFVYEFQVLQSEPDRVVSL